MYEPAKQEDPQHAGQHELHDGHQQPALEELAEARDEEAAQCGDDVSGGALRHGASDSLK
jgi:hypothetical protein